MEFSTVQVDPMAELLADPTFTDAYFADLIATHEAAGSDVADPAFDETVATTALWLDIDELTVPGRPGVGVEELNRYARVAAARQDELFHDLLTDAATNPDPWVGPDPTQDPAWTPPRDMSIATVRARRRDLAVRATAMDIALRTRLSENQVRNRAHRAQSLSIRCPKLWAAYLAGDISEQNAGTAATLASTLPADRDAWAAFDEAVLNQAQRLTAGKFRHRAREIRERVHPESVDTRHARAAQGRGVWITPQPDGMGSVEALVTATSAQAVDEYLDAYARHLAAQPDETRTLAQLRADIFIDLLLNGGLPAEAVASSTDDAVTATDVEAADEPSADVDPDEEADAAIVSDPNPEAAVDVVAEGDPAGDDTTKCPTSEAATPTGALPSLKGIKATVRITIPALTLLGQSDEPATLDGYGPIDTETAKRLAGTATSWIRVLTHPVTGTVLDVDRKMYRVPADLRRWIETKHPTCIFPGCNRPARRCDIDHRTRWTDGGKTASENLAPWCEPHHNVKDETLWQVLRDPITGAFTFISPTGQIFDADPPPF